MSEESPDLSGPQELPGTTSLEGVVPEHLVAATEAMLFAAERALSPTELAEFLSRVDEMEIPESWVLFCLEKIQARYLGASSGFQLQRVGESWEFRTRGAFADYVLVMYRRKPVRLSRAALEVLAVIAYRQPCTRADIDDIRGVDSSAVLRQLLERDLIRILGKSDDVGRPMIYGTSQKFLSFFGLRSLSELPTLREFTELSEEHLVKLQELDATLAANRTAQPELPGLGAATFAPQTEAEVGAVAAPEETEFQRPAQVGLDGEGALDSEPHANHGEEDE
jgi:segregation and condensation protein B